MSTDIAQHPLRDSYPWFRSAMWQIHFDIWQNQYNIAKLNKIKLKKEKKENQTEISKKKKKKCNVKLTISK